MSISPTCTAPLTPTEREPLASEWSMRGTGETVPIRERIGVNAAAHTGQTAPSTTHRSGALNLSAASAEIQGNLALLGTGTDQPFLLGY